MPGKTEDPYKSDRYYLEEMIDLNDRLVLYPEPGKEKISENVAIRSLPGKPSPVKEGTYRIHKITFFTSTSKLTKIAFPDIEGRPIQSNKINEKIETLFDQQGINMPIRYAVTDALVYLDINGRSTPVNYEYCTKTRR